MMGLFGSAETDTEECDHNPGEAGDEVDVRRGPERAGRETSLTAWTDCEECGADIRYHHKRGWIVDDGWLSDDRGEQ